MKFLDNLLKTFQKIWYRRNRKKCEKEILRDLELLYEINKDVYEHNCAQRNLITKICSKTEMVFFKPEEILKFELYFSYNEEKYFRKIGLDIENVIRKFEKSRSENFMISAEYVCARYPQISKKIDVGDQVLKYSFYSQIYKRSFRIKDEELKNESTSKDKKAINFFDYYGNQK